MLLASLEKRSFWNYLVDIHHIPYVAAVRILEAKSSNKACVSSSLKLIIFDYRVYSMNLCIRFRIGATHVKIVDFLGKTPKILLLR